RRARTSPAGFRRHRDRRVQPDRAAPADDGSHRRQHGGHGRRLMFLGAYYFDGPPPELIPAYERLMAGFPPDGLELHVCVVRDGGLTVYDACPSAEIFAAFS